jgi:hypothetical protein
MQKQMKRKPAQYDTWYDFKKDLETRLWCHIENGLWLKIKPKKALPWHGAEMETALSRLLESKRGD